MIGIYVHHVGTGHLRRASTVAAALATPVTGLSSLPAPEGWPGPWLRLERDDDGEAVDPTARRTLHWVPKGHDGLRARMSRIASWIRDADPRVLVVDGSVEVAALARLHGVPVVAVAQPGERGDSGHRLGFDLAEAIVGCWPPTAPGMLRGIRPGVLEGLHLVGALSRFAVREHRVRRPGPRRAVLVSGGGREPEEHQLELARKETPDWEWTVLDRELGEWVGDSFPVLCDADVVVTHAGQDALAEVAAARVPAVVVPQPRPHAEQQVTGAVLARGRWPAVVRDAWPDTGWAELLERAAALDGSEWRLWCDGQAARRFADVVHSVARGEQP
jgi:glycosyl transferase family 28